MPLGTEEGLQASRKVGEADYPIVTAALYLVSAPVGWGLAVLFTEKDTELSISPGL